MTNKTAHKILIDITTLVCELTQKAMPTGIDRVCVAYINHYKQRAAGAVIQCRGYPLVLSSFFSMKLFDLFLAHETISLAKMWSYVLLGIVCGQRNIDNAFVLKIDDLGVPSSSYVRNTKKRRLRPIFLIHDILPYTHPEFFPELTRQRFIKFFDHASEVASGFILNSEDTLKQVRDYASQCNKILVPSVVAHLSSGHYVQKKHDRPIATPYFTVIGTIQPRKNHYFLLLIWLKLIERHGVNTPRLVIIGKRGWKCDNVIHLLETSEALRTYVHECSVNDETLDAFLQHTQALLFPTFQEGFGMPLVEAIEKRTPVIASDLAVFREIASDVPEYLDPLNGPGWIHMIEQYSSHESPMRREQLSRMDKLKLPGWEEHFSKVNGFFELL